MVTWRDVERRFGGDPLVAWDRDMAPAGWDPILRIRYREQFGGGELWADDAACGAWHSGKFVRCRCVVWNGQLWFSRIAMLEAERKQRERFLFLVDPDTGARSLHVPRASGKMREWSRSYLGFAAPPEPRPTRCPACGGRLLRAISLARGHQFACADPACVYAHGF